MSSWNKVLEDVQSAAPVLDSARQKALLDLAGYRGRNVVCYYSGWLQDASGSAGVSITDDDMNGLMNAFYGLNRDKGLDLVLHTPGGDLAAAEAIVKYVRDCFGKDVVAIVPQMAMSAGTMIACSCREVIMGRQSSLGPTDPQLGGIPAGGVIEEFDRAVEQVSENPASAALWGQIIGKYHPTFLGDCQKAVEMSRGIVRDWLATNMFDGDGDAEEKIASVVDLLCEHKNSAMHNRHFSHEDLAERGLKVVMLEDDNDLQDLVLTLHHTYMISFQKTSAVKVIESSGGGRWIASGPTA